MRSPFAVAAGGALSNNAAADFHVFLDQSSLRASGGWRWRRFRPARPRDAGRTSSFSAREEKI